MIKDRNLTPGTTLVRRYKGKEHRAKVVAGKDGNLRYRLADGRQFKSPSGAGSAVMGGAACNGWVFWTVVPGRGSTAHRSAKSAVRKTPKKK